MKLFILGFLLLIVAGGVLSMSIHNEAPSVVPVVISSTTPMKKVDTVVATPEKTNTEGCALAAEVSQRKAASSTMDAYLPARCPPPSWTPAWEACINNYLATAQIASDNAGEEAYARTYKSCISR